MINFWKKIRRNPFKIEDFLKLGLGILVVVVMLILIYFITNFSLALADDKLNGTNKIAVKIDEATENNVLKDHVINSNLANNQNVLLVKKFGSWSLIMEKQPSLTPRCHLVSKPIYTKLFSGLRYDPYLMISYIPENKFTYGVFSGFALNSDKAPVIILQDYQYPLTIHRDAFAYTYDAFEDMSITNTIVKGVEYIRVKSYNRKKQLAMDYYSVKNLLEAMNFTRSYCKEFLDGNVKSKQVGNLVLNAAPFTDDKQEIEKNEGSLHAVANDKEESAKEKKQVKRGANAAARH